MAEEPKKRRRLVAKARDQSGEEWVKRSFKISRRMSGLLGYRANMEGVDECVLVERALREMMKGYRVSVPGDPESEDSPVG